MKSDAPLSPDDPRLSAYLLGELPADEALVFEAQLRQSPAAREELEELRAMCDLLRDSLEGELAEHAADSGQPALSLLPTPEPDEKVVAFDSGSEASPWARPARFASLGALAAAVVVATVMLPNPADEPGAGSGMVASTDEIFTEAEVSASTPAPALAEAAPSGRVPRFGYQGAASSLPAGGASPVAIQSTAAADAEFLGRSLGSDPTITEVRFLSDDPIDLRSEPLPAELLSYLPEDQGGIRPVHFTPSSADATPERRGIRHLYLDTEKYPDPDIVHNRVELTGGVFRVGGEQTRSLYRTEQRSDPAGRTSVILKGMVRLEAGEKVSPVIDEPDPTYDFGPLTVSWKPGVGEVISLPSGGTLHKAESATMIGGESSDIAERYVVRLQEKSRRAQSLGRSAERLLEAGAAAAAATQLEMALQLIPDAPATADLRDELETLLREADAAIEE